MSEIISLPESKTKSHSVQFSLQPEDNLRLSNLCGQHNEHLSQIETRLKVSIDHRGMQFQVVGEKKATRQAESVIKQLYKDAQRNVLSPGNVQLYLQDSGLESLLSEEKKTKEPDAAIILKLRNKTIKARGSNQQHYLKKVESCDINFGIGPAGTGKTYLAVALAIKALEEG